MTAQWPGFGGTGGPPATKGGCLQGKQPAKEAHHQGAGLAPTCPSPSQIFILLSRHAPARSCGWSPPLPTTETSQGANSRQGPDPAIGILLPQTKSQQEKGAVLQRCLQRERLFKKRRGRQGKDPKRACQACVFPGTAQPMSDLGPHSQSLSCFTCHRSEQVTGSEVLPSQDTLKPRRRDDAPHPGEGAPCIVQDSGNTELGRGVTAFTLLLAEWGDRKLEPVIRLPA